MTTLTLQLDHVVGVLRSQINGSLLVNPKWRRHFCDIFLETNLMKLTDMSSACI